MPDKDELLKKHVQALRERLLSEEQSDFSAREILFLLLSYCFPAGTAERLADKLLEEFGSLPLIFGAPYGELMKVDGMTENAAVFLKLTPQYSRFISSDKLEGKALDTSKRACAYFLNRYIGIKNECVMAAYLDKKLRVISCVVLDEGNGISVELNERKVVEAALNVGSNYIIISHNHPHGLSRPSREDIIATRTLSRTLNSLDMKLMDHIVVGYDGATSMRISGALNHGRL